MYSLSSLSPSLIQRRTSQKFYRTTEELTEAEESEIIGNDLPKWFKGTYMRNGPGMFDYKDGFSVNHWFDGYSVISKFHIMDGKVRFEKKFLQSAAFKKFVSVGRPCVCEFGTGKFSDPSRNWMSRLYNTIVPEFTDNANISLFNLGQNVFASGETCFFYDLNPSTLTPGQKFDTNKIFGLHVTSPHPLTDRNGYTYNIGSSYAPTLKYCVVKIPPAKDIKDPKQILKKAQIICSIPSRFNRNVLSYNHSFGLTENYVVFVEQPYVVCLNKILSSVISKGQSFRDWVDWLPELKNRFYIIDKHTGKQMGSSEFFSQESFFFIHMINCYEENGQVVVTLSSYNDPTVLDTQFLSILREGGTDGDETRAAGHQYVVPIDALNASEASSDERNLVKVPGSKALAFRQGGQIILVPEVLTDRGMEFPAINKQYTGRKHRYYYASGLTSLGDYRNAVVKVDLLKKETLCWRDSLNYFIGEPIFVPNPELDYDDMESEDRGVLILPVSDYRESHEDFLLFLDARSFKEIARCPFKTPLPTSIHGIFMLKN